MARSYYVYVIELRVPEGTRGGPRRPLGVLTNGAPPPRSVYVGSSSFTPEERARRHHEGGEHVRYASRYVRRFGGRLLPALYAHLNRPPFATRDDAKVAEKKLRAELQRRGYKVYGSCRPHGKSCRL